MNLQNRIDSFLDGAPHAVVGASQNRNKYGNKVLRAYQQAERPVYPVHPCAEEIEGLRAYPDLASLPEAVHGISIITPPAITERIVKQAGTLGIQHLWMQPGAESARAIETATAHQMNVIGGDACLLVAIGFREM
jgi:predicted CoA-binding protein